MKHLEAWHGYSMYVKYKTMYFDNQAEWCSGLTSSLLAWNSSSIFRGCVNGLVW